MIGASHNAVDHLNRLRLSTARPAACLTIPLGTLVGIADRVPVARFFRQIAPLCACARHPKYVQVYAADPTEAVGSTGRRLQKAGSKKRILRRSSIRESKLPQRGSLESHPQMPENPFVDTS